jgi:hypothetical protein
MMPGALFLAVACVASASSPALADQVRTQEWWLRALHVPQAWQVTQGAGVTIAVLDTGVNSQQPDLRGSVLPGPDYTRSGETPASPFYAAHGTAVASLIAGHGHGGGARNSGIVGIAPAARILPVRVTLDPADPLLASSAGAAALPDAIASGIRYAVRQGAKVIDLPLDPRLSASPAGQGTGTPSPPATTPAGPTARGGSPAEQSAVAYALSQGVVLVAPAGDNAATGNAVNYPAAYPGVISVGAFNKATVKSAFSIRQPYVKLTAPGDGVLAATLPHGYATMNSTSAASAIVSGIAALVRAEYPQLSPGQVTQALEHGTAFRPDGKTGVGSGFGTADAAKALTAAATIAGSGAVRGGSGAVPRSQPAVPAVPPTRANTTSKVARDALISAAVLLLLLIPIGLLGLARRRRAGQAQAARGRPRYAGNAARGHPQPGYLAAPAGPGGHAAGRRPQAARAGSPGRSASPASAPAHGGPAGQPGSSVFTMPAPGQARAGGLGSPGGAAGGLNAGGPGGFSGSSSFTGLSPRAQPPAPARPSAAGQAPPAQLLSAVHRPAASRSPRVSGSPPWEPAPEPDSELPWAHVPPPQPHSQPQHGPEAARGAEAPRGPGALPRRAVPGSAWGAGNAPDSPAGNAAAAASGSGAAAGGASAAATPAGGAGATTPSGLPRRGAEAGGEADSQIFLWNPGATTDTFPALPERGRPGGAGQQRGDSG